MFKKKVNLSFEANFIKKKKWYSGFWTPIHRINDVFSGIVAAIAGIVTTLTTTGVTIGAGIGLTWAGMAYVAIIAASIGYSVWSSNQAKRSPHRSMDQNGQLVNTKMGSEPVKVAYGICKVGMNWVYAEPWGANHDQLHICGTWSEGEILGVGKGIDRVVTFAGSGLDDLRTGGLYVGAPAEFFHFRVQIDSVGAPDTFRWSPDGGNNWTDPDGVPTGGTAITGGWQTLWDGVQIRFDATTGHTFAVYWDFYAGDGYWAGDHLFARYMDYPYGQLGYVATYNGTATQNVDPWLDAIFPHFADAFRYTAYSRFTLLYNTEAYRSIPDFYALVYGRLLYDTRTSLTGFSRNPALVVYDILTNPYYGYGLPVDRIITSSINDCANWFDANGFNFDGVIMDRDNFIDHLENIMVSYRMFMYRDGGKYGFKVYTDDTPVMTLTEADIEISPESFEISDENLMEKPNRVVGSFTDSDLDYVTNWADYYDNTLMPIGTDPRDNNLSLIGHIYFWAAKKICKYYYMRGLFSKTFSAMGHTRCINLTEGDTVYVTHEFPGWTNKKLRVKSIGIPQQGLIPLVLMDEDASIYDQDIDVTDRLNPHRPQWNVTLVTPTNPSATTGPDESTRNKEDAYIDFSWDNMGEGISYKLKYRKAGEHYFQRQVPPEEPEESTVTSRVGALISGTEYEWQVEAFVSGGYVRSEWTAVQNITTWETSLGFGMNTQPSGDVSHSDGSLAYVGTILELHDCDSAVGWVTDSAVDGSVEISLEETYRQEGTGSIKVAVWRYPKVRYFEDGVSIQKLGYSLSDKVFVQGFKLTEAKDIKAVGLEIQRHLLPTSDIDVDIYSSDAGLPDASLGSTTLLVADVPTTWLEEPKKYTYAIFDPAISLLADTLYFIVLSIPGFTSTTNYYRIRGKFTTGPNEFGDLVEIFGIGGTIGTLVMKGNPYNWDMNFRACEEGDALDKYVYVTFGAKDASLKTYFKNWFRSSRDGAFLSQAFGEAAINEQTNAVTIDVENQWEWEAWDISAIAVADRDGVTRAGIKITNMDEDFILYLDYIITNIGLPVPQIRRSDDNLYSYMLLEDTELNPAIKNQHENLLILNSVGDPSHEFVITCDEVTVQDANGTTLRVRDVDRTLDIDTSGLDGLDTGVMGNFTIYYIWIIYDASTGAQGSLLSLSSTLAGLTLPAGYTFGALVGGIYSSVNGHLPTMYQRGRVAVIEGVQFVTNGVSTAVATITISTRVPLTAKYALISFSAVYNTASGFISVFTYYNATILGVQYAGVSGSDETHVNHGRIPIIGGKIYYNTSAAGCRANIWITGWEF